LGKMKHKLGVKVLDIRTHSPARIYVELDPADIRIFASFMKEEGVRFSTATGIDTGDAFEILYHFSDDGSGKIISLRVRISGRENPCIDTISDIIKAAEWIEREIWEMLGINFKGHPDLRRLLLPDDWPEKVYPMRKDYVLPEHERVIVENDETTKQDTRNKEQDTNNHQ